MHSKIKKLVPKTKNQYWLAAGLWSVLLVVFVTFVVLAISNADNGPSVATSATVENPDGKVDAVGSKAKLQSVQPEASNTEDKGAAQSPTNPDAVGVPHVDLLVEGLNSPQGIGYYTENGNKSRNMKVELRAKNANLSACKLSDSIVLDDQPLTQKTVAYAAKALQTVSMEDGLHTLTVSCSVGAGISDTTKLRILDRQPKKCADYGFTDTPVTASSLENLQQGIIGNWKGCVSTPWVPAYFVTMSFKSDGTYSAVSDESLDGMDMNAMYYGTQRDDAKKKYWIQDFNASKAGTGEIDVLFDVGSINRGTLRNVKLMGNKLSFDFYHRNQYGPVTFQLTKQ